MKVKVLSMAVLAIMLTACGPSAAEQEVHEEKRETAEQELEENWEDDLDEMMEELDESEQDSSVVSESDSL